MLSLAAQWTHAGRPNGFLEVILQAEYCIHSTTVWRTKDWHMAPTDFSSRFNESVIEASCGMDSRQEPGTVPDSGSAPEPGMFVNICQFFFRSSNL